MITNNVKIYSIGVGGETFFLKKNIIVKIEIHVKRIKSIYIINLQASCKRKQQQQIVRLNFILYKT